MRLGRWESKRFNLYVRSNLSLCFLKFKIFRLDHWTFVCSLGSQTLLYFYTPDSFQVLWKGICGLQWNSLYFHISMLAQFWPSPAILIINLGGNNVGKQTTLGLIFMIKLDLHTTFLSLYSSNFFGNGSVLCLVIFFRDKTFGSD